MATLWVRDAQGNDVDGVNTTSAEQQEQVIILHIETESGGELNVVFRRAEFSGLCSAPNREDAATEVAVHIEVPEDADERIHEQQPV